MLERFVVNQHGNAANETGGSDTAIDACRLISEGGWRTSACHDQVACAQPLTTDNHSSLINRNKMFHFFKASKAIFTCDTETALGMLFKQLLFACKQRQMD